MKQEEEQEQEGPSGSAGIVTTNFTLLQDYRKTFMITRTSALPPTSSSKLNVENTLVNTAHNDIIFTNLASLPCLLILITACPV